MSKMEGLEARRLMSMNSLNQLTDNLVIAQAAGPTLVRVKSVVGDNRGEVVVTLSEKAVGVKGAAAQLYTAGADGKLFTNDDVKESVRFTYSENKKQIKLTAKLKKDTPYRIKLDGKTRIKSAANGLLLDGDYQASGASGDGKAGGNFECQFGRDKTATPTAVMKTSQGDFQIKLRGDLAPKTVANFMSYANSGRYDNIFFTRNDPGFVIQGGGLRITGDGQDASDIVTTPRDADLADEAPGALPSVRGTIAFARGNNGDDATAEFFINLGDNSSLDSQGFTSFGELTSGTVSVADTISQLPIVAMKRELNASPQGVLENIEGASLAHVPVLPIQPLLQGGGATVVGVGGNIEQQYLVTGGLIPNQYLVIVYRVAAYMNVSGKAAT